MKLNATTEDESTSLQIDASVFDDNSQMNNSSIDDPYKHEKLNCFFLYKKFLKEVHIRKKQFKDELLASSLEFILSITKELAVHNLNEIFESLEVI